MIECQYSTGANIYAVIRNVAGQWWYPTGTTFESYNALHWTSYAVALTEVGAGLYQVAFPTAITMGITTAGRFSVSAYLRAGGSPAVTDQCLGTDVVQWDGSAEMGLLQLVGKIIAQTNHPINNDSFGNVAIVANQTVRLDMTQTFPTSPTAGTVGEALAFARAQGGGKWTVDKTAKTLTIFKVDGTTPLLVFDLTPDASAALARVPR